LIPWIGGSWPRREGGAWSARGPSRVGAVSTPYEPARRGCPGVGPICMHSGGWLGVLSPAWHPWAQCSVALRFSFEAVDRRVFSRGRQAQAAVPRQLRYFPREARRGYHCIAKARALRSYAASAGGSVARPCRASCADRAADRRNAAAAGPVASTRSANRPGPRRCRRSCGSPISTCGRTTFTQHTPRTA
jgi:hypothetical protein